VVYEVTLTGDLTSAAAAAQSTFTASNWLTDSTDELLIPPAPIQSVLPAAGTFSHSLLATDNTAPLPQGWYWTASFQVAGINANSFSFYLPASPSAFTATDGTPCVFTSGSTYSSGAIVALSGPGLPGGFGPASTYYTTAAGTVFSLAASSGGSALASTSAGSGTIAVTQVDISQLAPLSPVPPVLSYLPLPAGTPAYGDVPTVTRAGSPYTAWEPGGGGGGTITSVTAGDESMSAVTSGGQVTLETGTLDEIATLHPPAGNWSNNSRKITSLADGSAAADAAAFGQIPVSASAIGGLLAANNLDDVASESTARTNLGLGSAATQASSAFAQTANNLSDLASETTALSNLGALPKAGGTMTGWLAPAVSALSESGGDVAVNAALGNVFTLTLTSSSWTVSAPSNPVNGQHIIFLLTQGSGGSFTVSWASGTSSYNFGTAGAPTLSATAGDVDMIGFVYVGALEQWCYAGSALGF
jgi:hypothetical protein